MSDERDDDTAEMITLWRALEPSRPGKYLAIATGAAGPKTFTVSRELAIKLPGFTYYGPIPGTEDPDAA